MYSPSLYRRAQSSDPEGETGYYQLRSNHLRPGDRLRYVLSYLTYDLGS
jgi:hypothetical protein